MDNRKIAITMIYMNLSHITVNNIQLLYFDEVNVWIFLLLKKKDILNKKNVFNASDLIFSSGKCHCYFFLEQGSLSEMFYFKLLKK